MFYWLVQSQDAHPGLAQGIPPAGLLSEVEQARLVAFKTEKRRRDWLIGRWTAKHLLRQVIQEKSGEIVSLDELVIENNADGVPEVNGQWSMVNGQLSISHSNGCAFCAVAERPIGADMERIEARTAEFVSDYFTKEEQEHVACSVLREKPKMQHAIRNTHINAIWSAKEAALKALHLGLSVDTRAVTCLMEPFEEMPVRWVPFEVRCDEKKIGRLALKLTGRWRTMGEFVLTVVMAVGH